MPRRYADLLCPLLLVGLFVGCTRMCFLDKSELDAVALPPNIQKFESEPVTTESIVGRIKRPATVDDANRPTRYISLPECIGYALENGTVSSQGLQNGTGQVSNNMVAFTGGALASQSDYIRVLAYNPAAAFSNIEISEARFDAQWVTSVTNTYTDELTGAASPFTQNGTNASITSTIIKPLASGGVISTSFINQYQNLNVPNAGQINPLWSSTLQIGFEQPLLRDFGGDINQLLNRVAPVLGSAMPSLAASEYNNRLTSINQGSSLAGGGNVFTEGILIARIRFDSQRAEFERNVNNLVVNTEVAYWKLYQAYGQLYSYEELMRLVHKVWMIYKAKHDEGAAEGSSKNYEPILAKYWELRGNRLTALGAVLDAERNLRGIIGLKMEDGTRLVPVTPPTMDDFHADWETALEDTMTLKPELVLARDNVRLAQLNIINQKNFLKPDLRFFGTYAPVGFGTGMLPTGTGQMFNGNGNAISNGSLEELAGNHFNSWNVGLVLNVPIGYRQEQAALRQARLNLGQAYELLKDQEYRAQRNLTEQFQKTAEWHARISASMGERKAYGATLKAYLDEISVGKLVPGSDVLVVSGQLSQAMLKQFEAITEYNNSMARFEWAKGTLLQYNNVTIAESQLPGCVEGKATEHLKEATKALLLRQHPPSSPMTMPGQLTGDATGSGQPLTLAEARSTKQAKQTGAPQKRSPEDEWNARTNADAYPAFAPQQLPADFASPPPPPQNSVPPLPLPPPDAMNSIAAPDAPLVAPPPGVLPDVAPRQ